jgi:hypothetical protein
MKNDFVSRLTVTEDLISKADTTVSVVLSNILHRARILLMSRNETELNAIAIDIRDIIKEYERLIDKAACEVWENYEDIAPTRHSIPQLLRFCVGSVTLDERSVIDNPKWAEYFAVLALDSFNTFVESIKKGTKNYDVILDDGISCHLSCLVHYSDAHEAITMAESVDGDEKLSSEISQLLKTTITEKTRKQTRNAAQCKHTKTKELHNELLNYFQNGKFKSKKAAVRDFIDITPKYKYDHLAPTNLERTLYEGLCKNLKAMQKSD